MAITVVHTYWLDLAHGDSTACLDELIGGARFARVLCELVPLWNDALVYLDHFGVQNVWLLSAWLTEQRTFFTASWNRYGLVWKAISRASACPFVWRQLLDVAFSLTIRRAQRSPLRSKRALVATVVPIRRYSI